ncbi:MAG: hypothetical protein WBY53_16940 [Acidobacteriaceae bacterium]
MHSLAEWIISRFTSSAHAASIIGDLKEAQPEKGALWFWLSVAGIVLRFGWRPLLAFVAAFYGGNRAFSSLQMAVFGVPLDSPHRFSLLWQPTVQIFSGVAVVLWIGLIYSLVRYGLRDRLFQAMLALAAPISLILCCWWQPLALWSAIVLAVVCTAFLLLQREGRRAALGTLFFVPLAIASAMLCLFLASLYQRMIYSGPMGEVELRAHPSILWIGLGMWVLATLIDTTACAQIHRRLLDRRSPASEPEYPSRS